MRLAQGLETAVAVLVEAAGSCCYGDLEVQSAVAAVETDSDPAESRD